jgi:hypothetical protein
MKQMVLESVPSSKAGVPRMAALAAAESLNFAWRPVETGK